MRFRRKKSTSPIEPAPSRGGGAVEDEAAPAGDPTLPGLAGYPRRRGNDKMPTKRFTFVRPDGKPVQTGKDPRPDYW